MKTSTVLKTILHLTGGFAVYAAAACSGGTPGSAGDVDPTPTTLAAPTPDAAPQATDSGPMGTPGADATPPACACVPAVPVAPVYDSFTEPCTPDTANPGSPRHAEHVFAGDTVATLARVTVLVRAGGIWTSGGAYFTVEPGLVRVLCSTSGVDAALFSLTR